MPKELKPVKRGLAAAEADFFGRGYNRIFKMLFSYNIRRRVVTTLVSITAFAWQQPSAGQQPADSLPNGAGVVDAYTTARLWVNQFDAPRLGDADSRLPIENCTAVSIILRRSGRVVGIGSDSTGDELMVRRAVGRALNGVLANPALQRVSSQLRGEEREDSTLDDWHSDIGRTLTLELEAAGELIPLVGRSARHMAEKLSPGRDGVAVRNGQTWEFLFPSQLRATNLGREPEKLLLNAIVRARLPVSALEDTQQLGDVSLYRFHTIHFTQESPERLPFQTFRGQRIVPDSAVTTRAIQEFSESLAIHILSTMWPDTHEETGRMPLGIMGDYEPATDQYRPLVATPLDQALTAFALVRFSRVSGVNKDLAEQSKDAAVKILIALSESDSDPTADPAACAAITFCVTEDRLLRKSAAIESLAQSAQETVLKFHTKESNQSELKSLHTQAMIVGALCRLSSALEDESEPIESTRVRRLLDELWQGVPENERVGLLPWIGWAEEDLAAATNQPLQHIKELQQLLQHLEATRINSETSEAADLYGGFSLTSENSDSTSSPQATAQSVRPAAWMAGLFDHPEIIPPNESAAVMGRHLRTMRFLIQLSVRDECLWSMRNPSRAKGGLRASMWDSSQPVPAQALGLIAAMETLESLHKLP